ncbi:PREDICTED: beta-1,3-galactosyltransferase brn isoform X2 [Ceratosolen solmsi marchali]|uniref:Hexosyltransferase n=1 Tax=Ceratosolen solmsi marchali TaxID=326594 RepID=A0AAJ6YTX6_9HYME|nr:PREDICTED: beta-1,3-galactosyltransferase brn isoform X2 [Ceratosolen solmsi marchali]
MTSFLTPYFKMCLKLMVRIRLKHACTTVGIIFILDFFGVFTHLFEVSFDDSFIYPYEGDIHEFIVALRQNQKPNVPPINDHNFTFIHDIKDKCIEPSFQTLRVVFLIKSAVENYNRRMAIRNSWGFEKRFSDVPLKTVFLLGTHINDNELLNKINFESLVYHDIVQADFLDTYYNNTIKTMMGFKWAVKYCANSKFYMFVDDDIYISVKNVLRFLRNPVLYPDYLKDTIKLNVEHLRNRFKRSGSNVTKNPFVQQNLLLNNYNETMNPKYVSENTNDKTIIMVKRNLESKNVKKRQVFDFELPDDVRLFAGFVFNSSPHRYKSSKWYVSLKEYPYNMWPPYITAGVYILSKEALMDMYYASMYTKYFRFDDIFLGIAARKVDIEPFHCDEFHFYKKDYTKYNYKYVISSHGYSNPDELLAVWNEQKAMGNA